MLRPQSFPININVKGIELEQDEMGAMYTGLTVNDIVRLPQRQSGDSKGQETFLASSADSKTPNLQEHLSRRKIMI